MPPKPRFTREEITEAALTLVSEKGIDALTARELGAFLGSSARPIFTIFQNMEELYGEVVKAAAARLENTEITGSRDMPPFKREGMKMIKFGMDEPKLYQLLFMKEHTDAKNFADLFALLGQPAALSVKTIQNNYGLDNEKAKILFENMWIYTYGIGTLCATGVCSFTEEDASRLLTEQFKAQMMMMTSKN